MLCAMVPNCMDDDKPNPFTGTIKKKHGMSYSEHYVELQNGHMSLDPNANQDTATPPSSRSAAVYNLQSATVCVPGTLQRGKLVEEEPSSPTDRWEQRKPGGYPPPCESNALVGATVDCLCLLAADTINKAGGLLWSCTLSATALQADDEISPRSHGHCRPMPWVWVQTVTQDQTQATWFTPHRTNHFRAFRWCSGREPRGFVWLRDCTPQNHDFSTLWNRLYESQAHGSVTGPLTAMPAEQHHCTIPQVHLSFLWCISADRLVAWSQDRRRFAVNQRLCAANGRQLVVYQRKSAGNRQLTRPPYALPRTGQILPLVRLGLGGGGG